MLEDVTLREMFFDREGNSITQGQWRHDHPNGRRVGIATAMVLGVRVAYEFSGANHNPDPSGKAMIFEVTATCKGELLWSWWATSERAARRKYRATLWLARLGLAIVWHVELLGRSLRKGRAR